MSSNMPLFNPSEHGKDVLFGFIEFEIAKAKEEERKRILEGLPKELYISGDITEDKMLTQNKVTTKPSPKSKHYSIRNNYECNK